MTISIQVKRLQCAADSFMRTRNICPKTCALEIAESWTRAHPSSIGELALLARLEPPTTEVRDGFVDAMRLRAGLPPILRVTRMAG